MNITIGPPVSPTDFFDREDLVLELWDMLGNNSVLLAAPRRVGKSSVMSKLLGDPQPGFELLSLDCQNYDTPEDLVADLAVKSAELQKATRGSLGKCLSAVAKHLEELEVWEFKVKLRQQISGSWRAQGEAIVRELLKPDIKLLLIIDELPMLLHKLIGGGNCGKAQDLLDWLRYLRQTPEFVRHVRELLGGSIGLPRIASMIGSSHRINDLRCVEVGPFERPKAREFSSLLLASRDVALDEQTMEAFLDQIGTLFPIFIQIMASVVAAEVRRRQRPADAAMIRECYEQRALGPEFRTCFEDFFERLDRYYAPDEVRAARLLLRELAASESPLLKSTLLGLYQKELGAEADACRFDLLLTWLRDDFYVEEIAGGRVQFKIDWMRDWWRTYHGSRI